MSYGFDEQVEEYSEKASYFMSEGDSYKSNGDLNSSLRMYLHALRNFQGFLYASERLELPAGAGVSHYDPELRVNLLLTLANLSQSVTVCYIMKSDTEKSSYFISLWEDAIKAMGELKQYLNNIQMVSYVQVLENINLSKAAIETQKSQGVKPDPGFISKDQIERNRENIDSLVYYYNDQFNKTVDSVKIIRSLHISSLRKPTSYALTSERSSEGCFVATAAYSDENHPDLDTFREFRDTVLNTNIVGELLVKGYYLVGPHLALFVKSSPNIQRFIRRCLTFLASWMRNNTFT
jgi:hypothetical protein